MNSSSPLCTKPTSSFLAPGFADPDRLRPHAPNVEVVPIEEAGHYVQNEAPERVNAELLAWLQGQAVRPRPMSTGFSQG